MQSVKQSLLVLNRASNWRDGFVNVVRLATSEPEHNPEGWTEKYGFRAGSDGLGLGRRPAGRGTRPTWEIRRSDERLEGAFKVGKGEGLGRNALEQGGGCFWQRIEEEGKGGRQKGNLIRYLIIVQNIEYMI